MINNISDKISEKYTAKDIFNDIDSKIIGQTPAKKLLSSIIFNHYQNLKYKAVKKSNVLLYGPSGCGKTMLISTLANSFKVPYVSIDAMSLVGIAEKDYVILFDELMIKSEFDTEKAETGIIFIDEIDKLAKTAQGRQIQYILLKLVEGHIIEYIRPSTNHKIILNTENILFIVGGAFQELNKFNNNSIGFNSETVKELITTEKFIEYGLLAEFIGRFSLMVELNQLTKLELNYILTKLDNNLLIQYTNLLKAQNINLIINTQAIDYIIDYVYNLKLGARPLKSIIDLIFNVLLFDLNDKSLVITTKELKAII